MSSGGSGSAVSTTTRNNRSGGGGDENRFYNPPAVRRQQQLLLQQQQKQQQQKRTVAVVQSDNHTRPVQPERVVLGGGSTTTALAVPVPRQPVVNVTNLDRFIKSVTPLVKAHPVDFSSSEGSQKLYYSLSDLWETFGESSVYGVGVPLVLNGEDIVMQYYVPSLSGLQLYVDPGNPPSRCRGPGDDSNMVEASRERRSDCEADRQSANHQDLNSLLKTGLPMREKPLVRSSINKAEAGCFPGKLVFEYTENDVPFNRKALAEQISCLASQCPELRNYNSCDLLPSSWLSVAWNPIYRIPVGPTLKDLDSSFLTYHYLSTNSIGNGQPRSHGVGSRNVAGCYDVVPKVPLPVFGFASYRPKTSRLSPFGPLEFQQANSLLQAADTWLRNLRVYHHDYQFFLSHQNR